MIKTSLEVIKQENIENKQLIEIFFRILNIPDSYKKEKKQLNNFIINHQISKKTGMSDIYIDVNKFGIEEFEKKLLDKLNKFEFYDDENINILASLNKVPSLVNISASILKYKNEQIEKWDSLYIKPSVSYNLPSILNRRKKKSNLRTNLDGWKGITPYKPKKKNLTFIEKDSK